MKLWPCWCTERMLWELKSFLFVTGSFIGGIIVHGWARGTLLRTGYLNQVEHCFVQEHVVFLLALTLSVNYGRNFQVLLKG